MWPTGAPRETGAGLAEYILIVSLIAIVVLAGASLFGEAVADLFDGANSSVP